VIGASPAHRYTPNQETDCRSIEPIGLLVFTSGTLLPIVFVFALCERKNKNDIIGKYHAAAG